MLRNEVADDFVLATGKTQTVRQFVNFVASALNFDLEWTGEGLAEVAFDKKSGAKIIEIDKRFYRPAEVDILLGSAEKAKNVLGWKADVSVSMLAEIMAKSDYNLLK